MKMTVSLILNLMNFFITFYVIFWNLFIHNREKPWKERLRLFRFFTTDSNIFSAVASLIMALSECLVLSGVTKAVSFPVLILKFIATSSVTLTALTVVFFLGPVSGYREMYHRDSFHLHLTGPLMAIVSFVFFESGSEISLPLFILGAVPEIIYSCFYINRVLTVGEEKGGWPDFYHFIRKGKWIPSCVLMFLAGLIISLVLVISHNASL